LKSVLYLGCPVAERAEAEKLLAAARVSIVWADSVAYALSELNRREMPVLLDLSRGASALQVARDLRAQRPATLIFAVVDERRPDLTTEAVLEGMADVFARPLGGRRVANAIAREMAYESRHDGRAADAGRGDLYAQSPSMREVSALIARAATMRAGVLVRGEEGTGREIVGRAIHAARPSPAGAFVKIDCAAFDTEQLDAALFGSAQRSPNGDASRGLQRVSRNSRLFAAHGGTLYLQNVAEAPARAQARLARVLRDREAILSDTGEAVDLDVRPMAGVNTRFDHAVEEGRVREDLFRRLSVVRIDMPPLRSRREDIPALANYFLREICAKQRVPPKTLSRAALSLIAALPWRGNAAELRSLIDSIVTGLAGNRAIGLDDVLAHVRLDGGSAIVASGGTLRQARSRFEREYISSVLEQHHGRVSEAAKALGIQRTNLYRKMRSLRVAHDRGRS
jgi:two-component system nitrogen regulation response regulator NtrX